MILTVFENGFHKWLKKNLNATIMSSQQNTSNISSENSAVFLNYFFQIHQVWKSLSKNFYVLTLKLKKTHHAKQHDS